MPMTIFADGFHFRVRDGRVLLLWPDEATPGWDTRVEPGWMDTVEKAARERVPALRPIPLDRAGAWAGLYEQSPDRHAVVGLAPGRTNMYLVNGCSGHGVMHAPALGQLIAELICGEPPVIDVTPLRPSRFADGALNPSSDLL
jgi:sarcosine oxidase subunit beta